MFTLCVLLKKLDFQWRKKQNTSKDWVPKNVSKGPVPDPNFNLIISSFLKLPH